MVKASKTTECPVFEPQGLARSLAGHDRGRLYVIINENCDRVFVADGVHSHISSSKSKNIRHIQRIKDLSQDVEDLIREAKLDSDLVHILRVYRKEQSKV